MRAWFERLFLGRHGMDELSKALFWCGLCCFLLSGVLGGILNGAIGRLVLWLAIFQLIFAFVRAFSRRLGQREAENLLYLQWLAGRRRALEAFKERRRQSKDFRFFKCPGCGKMLRVPRGKGKLSIHCQCGYVLYRKT